MNENTENTTRPRGTVKVLAIGDNAAELERAALDEAREFFGTDPRLEIVPGYVAFRESDKRYHTAVHVGQAAPEYHHR